MLQDPNLPPDVKDTTLRFVSDMKQWKQRPATDLAAKPVQLLPRDLQRYKDCPGMKEVVQASLCGKAGIRARLEEKDWQAGIPALTAGV
jgi:hypothetical protein